MTQTSIFTVRVSLVGLVAALLAAPSFAVSWRSADSVALAPIPAAPVGVDSSVPAAAATVAPATVAPATDDWSDTVLGTIDRQVFASALRAATAAIERGDVANPKTLTIIDFSKASTEKRLWTVDLRTHELLFEELVAHGRGSGENFARSFSNVADSHQSSLGLYRTAETYIGKHGYSLRLDGLETGVNHRARERAIVIHAADYVSDAVAKAQGRIGRSHGCPAVRPEVSRPLIDAISGGDLVFAYYPDKDWLAGSTYLAAPTAVAAD